MRVLPAAVVVCIVSCVAAACHSGEVVGTTMDVVGNKPVRNATIVLKLEGKAPVDQNSSAAGEFAFSGLPSEGRATVKATHEEFTFGPIDVDLTDGRVVADLWALPAGGDGPTESVVKWFESQVGAFDDRATGYQAAWSKASFLGMSISQKIELSMIVAKRDAFVDRVPIVSSYARADREGLRLFHEGVEGVYGDTKRHFPKRSEFKLSEPLAVDVVKSFTGGRDADIDATRLKMSFREAWGVNATINLERSVRTQRVIASTFNSEWRSVRVENRKMLPCRVSLRGFVGAITEGDDSVSKVSEVFYLEHADDVVVAGVWTRNNAPRWFKFSIKANEPNAFVGEWGEGQVIGRRPVAGEWRGTR